MSSPVQESELSSNPIIDINEAIIYVYCQKYSDYFSIKDQLSCTDTTFVDEFNLHLFLHAIQRTILISKMDSTITFNKVYYIQNNNMTTIIPLPKLHPYIFSSLMRN